jgi:hypothetical protein
VSEQEWIAKFEKGAKAPFLRYPHENIAYNPEKGFIGFIWCEEDDALVVTKLVGDSIYWLEGLTDMLIERNMGNVYYTTYRHPKAFCKLFGGEVEETEDRDGKKLYHIWSTPDKVVAALNRRSKKCPA